MVYCPCGAEISIPPDQLAHGALDPHCERLWADDESAKERILSINLSSYDEIVSYPAGTDWDLKRKKVLFLQTALHMGIPWQDVVQFTRPYFGQFLNPPPIPMIVPIEVPQFTPPAFDIARQTPEQWADLADEVWKAYRDLAVLRIQEHRRQLLDYGIISEFARPRRSAGIAGQKKAPIADESTCFMWAVLHFFSAKRGQPLTWAQIAKAFPIPDAPKHPAPKATKATRKRAEQIRARATDIVRDLVLDAPE